MALVARVSRTARGKLPRLRDAARQLAKTGLQPTPVLVALAVGGTVTGQYLLVGRNAPQLALGAYALGVFAFLILFWAGRLARGATRFWTIPRTTFASRRRRLGVLAVALFFAAPIAVEVSGLVGFGAAAWGASLVTAVLGAVPEEIALVGWNSVWRSRLIALVRSREAAVVLGITLGGGLARVYALESYPSGVDGDEASFGLIARAIIEGHGPHPFGAAFLGDPALYSYLLVPSLEAFGQTVAALRLPSAIVGTLTVPAFFLLLRGLFGARPALVGTALLAGSAVHVTFSRLAINVAEVPLLTCIALLALWKGQMTRLAVWWLAAGVAGGFSMYFHFAARLIPLLVGFYFAYLLLARRGSWRSWLRGMALTFMGGFSALAPLGLHLLIVSYPIMEHTHGRLIFNNWDRVSAAQHSASLPLVLFGQLKTNVLFFLTGTDGSEFYSFTNFPMLAPVLGPLFVLGLVILLVRFHEPRYALLALWFWTTVMVGGALSIDSPQAHRLLLAVPPALAGVALAIEELLQISSPLTGRFCALTGTLAAAAIPLIGASVDLGNFFGPAAESRPWAVGTAQGRFVAGLGPEYRAYTLGAPMVFFDYSVTQFLASQADGDSIWNPAAELPKPVPPNRDLAFLIFPWTNGYLDFLLSLYPSGRAELGPDPGDRVGLTGVRVARNEVGRWQGLTARYGGVERVEADAGVLGGGPGVYPTAASWFGSLYVDKGGNYLFYGNEAVHAISVDGAPLATGQRRELSVGWHAFEVRGFLISSASRARVAWQRPDTSQTEPPPPYLLDARGILGNIRGRLTADGKTLERRDSAIGFRNLRLLWPSGGPGVVAWEGMLRVTNSGPYQFRLDLRGGDARLLIDGRSVLRDSAALGGPESPALQLAAGLHPLQVEFDWKDEPGSVELQWAPPGGEMTIVPPGAFERPGATL